MITCKQVDADFLPQYDSIPMRVEVTQEFAIEKPEDGLGGLILKRAPSGPYIKDFLESGGESAVKWQERFDISNWAFFMAFDGELPVGGAAVASRTKGVDMLANRDDLAVLWDIRVDGRYKRRGIGQELFDMAAAWARKQGLAQMKIECQNNNVPAVLFYHKQGAVLSAIDEYAYYDEPECRHETQFIMYLDL